MKKYVQVEDFKDFTHNFNIMVDVFNHSVSNIREDSKKTKEIVEKIGSEFGNIKTDLAVVREKTHTNNWMIKWIFGIIAGLVIAGVIGTFIPA